MKKKKKKKQKKKFLIVKSGSPGGTSGKEPNVDLIPGSRRSPGGQPTSGFLSGESLGQRSLAGYSLQSLKESDMTEAT